MKTMKTKLWLVLLFAAVACNRVSKNEPTDTLTSGETKVAMDDSYTFLFETLSRVFEDQNPKANIREIAITQLKILS